MTSFFGIKGAFFSKR